MNISYSTKNIKNSFPYIVKTHWEPILVTQSKSKYNEITPKVQILLDNDEDGISKHEELDKLKKEVVHIETCQMISEMTSDILETCLLKINY